MRLSRRRWLALAGGGLLAGLGARHYAFARPGDLDGAVEVAVRADPLRSFAHAEPERTRFGALAFRSGLVLSARHPAFGGFSGLWRSPDGGRLVAITDAGVWLTAAVTMASGTLAGLAEARLAPVLGPDGIPLGRGRSYDTESLAIADGAAFIGIERVHEVMRFDWERSGVGARGERLPVPPEARRLPVNAGIEALAVAPRGHPLAGAVIAIAEGAREGRDAPSLGLVLTGPRRGRFGVRRSDEFDPTDLAFLPDGEALLLERRFSVMTGPATRIRRLARDAIRPDALVDGPVIFEADAGYQIDNMEGLSLHVEGGRTVVTLMSDDNFSMLQRTLLLEFELVG